MCALFLKIWGSLTACSPLHFMVLPAGDTLFLKIFSYFLFGGYSSFELLLLLLLKQSLTSSTTNLTKSIASAKRPFLQIRWPENCWLPLSILYVV